MNKTIGKSGEGQHVLLTGATGFLGRQILSILNQDTSLQITAISRNAANEEGGVNVRWITPSAISNIILDGPISIIHAATDYGWGKNPIEDTVAANLILPLNLIEAVGTNLKSFITLDSFYNKIDRHYPYLKEYSRSKRLLIQWLKEEDVDYKVTRIYLEHVYGPGDLSRKFVPWLLREIGANRDVPLTSGKQIRDFIFVEDAAQAVVNIWQKSLHSVQPLMEFEVGCGEPLSIRDFAIRAKECLNSKSNLLFGTQKDREGEIAASVAQSAASQGLNWKPSFTLMEGISRTYESLKSL